MASSKFVKNPIIVALDIDDGREALSLARGMKDLAGCFKIGPRLVLRYGPEFVKELVSIGPVFLDHKFYDIPSTMEASLRATFDLGITLTTIHSSVGSETLMHLARVEKELNQKRPFCVLAVTVLTSTKLDGPSKVQALASSVAASGTGGLVCSPHEVANLKASHPHLFYVTPGIRSSTDAMDDQQRTMSAADAIKQGASAIVVGRPILKANDPIRAVQNLLSELV